MSPNIPNAKLKPSDVPTLEDNWEEFALTFDGYAQHGSLEACAAIANRKKPVTLTDYRTCLFFEQRRWRHFNSDPDPKTKAYLRSLLDGIRERVQQRKID